MGARISVVIPVYNEEEIVEQASAAILEHAHLRGWDLELLLVENGSRDKTWELIKALENSNPQIRALQVGSPGHGDYGLALKTGALASRGDLVINDEIDIGNFMFYDEAVSILVNDASVDMVVGSKTLAGSNDRRPPFRRFATWCVNLLLRVLLGFKGTDTHGLKVWRRLKLESTVRACVTGKDIFASEIIVRAERAGFSIREIPIEIEEKRQARINLWKRVPHVLKNIFDLFFIFHFGEPIHREAARYIVVAAGNVLLNTTTFNILLFSSGVTQGPLIFFFTCISYGIAIVNAFFWNKHWVFKHNKANTTGTYISFLAVTISMALFGSLMTYFLTTHVPTPFGLSGHVWANISLLLTIPVTFLGNFLGNKYLVFK